MIIVSGTSSTHMDTLVEYPSSELKKLGFPPRCIEGQGTSWIVADLSDVVLHVFDEATRQQLNLEKLYEKAPRVDWEQKVSHAIAHKAG